MTTPEMEMKLQVMQNFMNVACDQRDKVEEINSKLLAALNEHHGSCLIIHPNYKGSPLYRRTEEALKPTLNAPSTPSSKVTEAKE